jgi:crotonobetainyl-CoA:carnitine CoA-transferase CaiB-like acyl-CoA transferase
MTGPAMGGEPAGPLARFKVIDVSRVRAGPTAVRQFADWGAQVIKVESPDDAGGVLGGMGRHSADFQNLHRNKRSIAVNLKDPAGRQILFDLIRDADVFVENYRPDVKRRLGIDYETLNAINPRLVYASISGFGQDGPYANRAGMDQIAQGMGGLMSITGLPGQGPVRAGTAIADLASGLFCAIGIFIALLEREVSGKGQWVQSSLLQAQISLLDFQAARWLIDKEVAGQAGNDHPTTAPTGVFPTSDGFVNIASVGDQMFDRLCNALSAPAMHSDPRFSSDQLRLANRGALNEAIGAITRTRTSAEWMKALDDAGGVPCGPIYRIDEVFADPQVKHLRMAQEVHHPKMGPIGLVGQPVTLSRTPSHLRTAAPDQGDHTAMILAELGYTTERIGALRAAKAI